MLWAGLCASDAPGVSFRASILIHFRHLVVFEILGYYPITEHPDMEKGANNSPADDGDMTAVTIHWALAECKTQYMNYVVKSSQIHSRPREFIPKYFKTSSG